MVSSFSASGEVPAQVATQRISQEPDANDPGPAPVNSALDDAEDHPVKEHHKHSIFGLVSLHGFLLAFGFFALTFGALGIRSGLSNSYKVHWVIQTSAGSAIVLGCLMGIYISFKVSACLRILESGAEISTAWWSFRNLSSMDRSFYDT
jgi:hypothetical protein